MAVEPDILEELALEGDDIGQLPKWRRLDVSLPPSWEPSYETVVEKSKEIAVVDNRAVEESGLPVFDVHLYILTITCLQIEKILTCGAGASAAPPPHR